MGVTLPPEPKYYQNYIHYIKILGVTLHQVLMKYEDLNIVGVTLPQKLNMINTIYTIKPLEQHYTRFLIYEVLTLCWYYMIWIPCDMYFLSVPNILTLWPWPLILTYFWKKLNVRRYPFFSTNDIDFNFDKILKNWKCFITIVSSQVYKSWWWGYFSS